MKLRRRLLAFALLQPAVATAQFVQRCAIGDLNRDHLQERLTQFRSNHKGTSCLRRPVEELGERQTKVGQSPWLDCGLRGGRIFEAENFIGINPTEPFDVLASFYNNKLVELTFTLDASSIEDLLPKLESCYGEASLVTRNSNGTMMSAGWIDREAELNAELVTITPTTAGKDFLRVEHGTPRGAVRIQIRSTRPLKTDHPSWGRNSMRGMGSFIIRHPWILALLL